MELTENTKIIGFADDIALVVTAQEKILLNSGPTNH